MTFLRATAGLALLFGWTASPTLAQSPATDGERQFRTRCGACHALDPSQTRPGPNLAGVLGRAAGTVEGARYSTAMRDSGLVWTEENLDAYLAAPRQVVPGTSMTLSLRDAGQREAIITFLRDRPTAP